MKRLAITAFGLALMIVPLANCSSGGSKDDCGDIAKKACEKLYACDYFLITNGVRQSQDQCTNRLTALSASDGDTDAECRDAWKLLEDLSCTDFANTLNASL